MSEPEHLELLDITKTSKPRPDLRASFRKLTTSRTICLIDASRVW